MPEDYDIEDIFSNCNKKKKKNSKDKGARGERDLVSIFNKRFSSILLKNLNWGKFYRSVGSGSRWSQATLSDDVLEMYSGDLICKNFNYVIESKIGYNHIDLFSILCGNSKEIDDFLNQVTRDSERCRKKPMLIWKKNRKPRLAFVLSLEKFENLFDYKIIYKNWTIILLDTLLQKLPDEFFFNDTGI